VTKRKSIALLVAGIVVFLLVIASEVLFGQPLLRGCGFRLQSGARATWYSFGQPTRPATVIPIDPSARPWGPLGIGPENHAAYIKRYAGGDPTVEKRGGMTLQGEANERAWRTWIVLEAACKDGAFGRMWDCVPTREEVEDYSAVTRRGSGFYSTYDHLFRAAEPPPPVDTNPPCPICPAAKPCPEVTCPPAIRLLPVPARIRETVDIMATWDKPIGPGVRARLKELQRWMKGTSEYRPGTNSTGSLKVEVVSEAASSPTSPRP
jgi:hypothetical protein